LKALVSMLVTLYVTPSKSKLDKIVIAPTGGDPAVNGATVATPEPST